jgi:hypothetical protein
MHCMKVQLLLQLDALSLATFFLGLFFLLLQFLQQVVVDDEARIFRVGTQIDIAGLQNVQLAVLDGELHVLNGRVSLLQLAHVGQQLLIRSRVASHQLLQNITIDQKLATSRKECRQTGRQVGSVRLSVFHYFSPRCAA